MTLNKTIRDEITELLVNHPQSLNLINKLSRIGELLFFGGSIREYCLNNEYRNMPRDFDIAIKFNNKNKNSENVLDGYFSEFIYRKNRFGGYKVQVEDLEFDIWDINNTWAFKEKKLPAEEENLIKSVYLNVDGVVYNFNKNKLYNEELTNSINNKEIDIVLKENPQKNLNLLRAIVFKKKYKYEFSERLKTEFLDSMSKDLNLVETLIQLQNAHYKNIYVEREEIIQELSLIH